VRQTGLNIAAYCSKFEQFAFLSPPPTSWGLGTTYDVHLGPRLHFMQRGKNELNNDKIVTKMSKETN